MVGQELQLLPTPEKGEVSAWLIQLGDACHLLILGQRANTNMRKAALRAIKALADARIVSFQFPAGLRAA